VIVEILAKQSDAPTSVRPCAMSLSLYWAKNGEPANIDKFIAVHSAISPKSCASAYI
jgi:hypothetical protein